MVLVALKGGHLCLSHRGSDDHITPRSLLLKRINTDETFAISKLEGALVTSHDWPLFLLAGESTKSLFYDGEILC